MTCELYIKSLILALQNRGGYWCRLVKDNPSDRRYCMLSWLFAAASAFVYIIHLACSARGLRIANGMPPICHLSPSEAHRNLTEGLPRDPKGIYRGYIRDINRTNTAALPHTFKTLKLLKLLKLI